MNVHILAERLLSIECYAHSQSVIQCDRLIPFSFVCYFSDSLCFCLCFCFCFSIVLCPMRQQNADFYLFFDLDTDFSVDFRLKRSISTLWNKYWFFSVVNNCKQKYCLWTKENSAIKWRTEPDLLWFKRGRRPLCISVAVCSCVWCDVYVQAIALAVSELI